MNSFSRTPLQSWFSNFSSLQKKRRTQHETHQAAGRHRSALGKAERSTVLSKTANHCHICGGLVGEKWSADHVLAHSGGGPHALDNYLPAHKLCNGARWDYLPEEFQWVIKIGIWSRAMMQKSSSNPGGSQLGRDMAARFLKHEIARDRRKQTPEPLPELVLSKA